MPKVNTPMAPIYAINKPFYDVADYGNLPSSGIPDGVASNSAMIIAAANAALAAGGGVVFLGEGTWRGKSLPLYSGVYYLGAGIGTTTIKLEDGANTDLFSAQTNLINLSAAVNSGSVGTLHNFGFANMTLDGNKANQTGGTSYPLRFYGYNFIIRDIEVLNGYTGGYLSDWNGGFGITAPSDQMESLIDTCKSHDNNGIGFQYSGPHDSRLVNVLSFNNVTHNFHLAPNANGILMSQCHGYGLLNTTGVCSFLIESGTGFNAINCIAEGASQYGVVILGALASWVGGGIWNGATGLQLGQAAGQTPFPGQINQSAGVTTASVASGANIDTIIANCTTTSINFANESSNKVDANIYQTAGSYITGTPATGDTYRINGVGLTADGTLAKSGGMQIVSSANPAFMVRNSSGGNLFHIDGSTGGTSGVDVPGGFHMTAVGGVSFNTGPNSGISLLVAPSGDAITGLLIFPNSSNQSAPLLAVQNSGFSNVFTVDKNGNIVTTATLSVGQSASAPALATSGTITTAGIGEARVAPTGAVTGVILQAGTQAGQCCEVVNESAFTVTFAAAATSNVADGVSAVISATRKMSFTWNNSTSKWYHS